MEGRVSIGVGVDNFVRAETDRMFAALQADAGGVNVFRHNREPTSIEDQTVIRMNRDTLYSFAIADISEGAVVTVPESGDRYLSVMVVNQDHYINRLFHDPGEYDLTVAEFDTPWVLVAVRVLVDPVDPADIAGVTAIQDEIRFAANASNPFEMPDYEPSSFDATRKAVLDLAKHVGGLDHAFGTREEVNPVRHLIGTAAGWGGLPDREARYVSVAILAASRATTRSRWETCRLTASGRSRSTTPMASLSGTIETPTASTTSPPPGTTTARSPSTSAAAATTG
jgi:Protein of unknown function (DUF1254)